MRELRSRDRQRRRRLRGAARRGDVGHETPKPAEMLASLKKAFAQSARDGASKATALLDVSQVSAPGRERTSDARRVAQPPYKFSAVHASPGGRGAVGLSHGATFFGASGDESRAIRMERAGPVRARRGRRAIERSSSCLGVARPAICLGVARPALARPALAPHRAWMETSRIVALRRSFDQRRANKNPAA